MSAIYCRLIFHNFRNTWIDKLLQLTSENQFVKVNEVNIQQKVSLDSDLAEKNTEVQFSFRLRATPEGRRLSNSEKYEQICLALCELTEFFERYRREFYNQGNPDSATVTLTLLSKNIYPQHFDLQNVFAMDQLMFGSIVNRQAFAPTYLFKEPPNDRNQHEIFEAYLDEQRDLHGIPKNMIICFEHDREYLTICFPDVIETANSPLQKRVVDIKVAYNSLRRVIVYMSRGEHDVINASFTFQLNYPPTIQIYEMAGEGSNANGKKTTKFKPPHRFLTWNPNYEIKQSVAHASCLVANCCMVNARTLLDCFDRLRKSNNYAIEFRRLHEKKYVNISKYMPNRFMHPDDLTGKYEKLKNEKYFPLVYAVQALITRAGEIYDYFFRPEYNKFYEFLDYVVDQYENDLRLNPGAKIAQTVITLENMLLEIDKAHDMMEPLKIFLKLSTESGHRTLTQITEELAREGYMRVRKIVVTPTRKLFITPELMMGNRSLRKLGADRMLRVVFRDDDNNKVSVLPEILIKNTVTDTLSKPLNVGFINFSYLCSSNSQLRDHGCYFMAGTPKEVTEFRNSCGKFKVESIPKMMSRMGQCFTQARELGIEISRGSYSETFDYIGGADSNGKPYTFSDGCGRISQKFCRKIVSDLKLGNCRPSCFQIRFRGYKGVVTMDSFIDKTCAFAKKYNLIKHRDRNVQRPWYCQSIIFRPSQKKFYAPREKHIEIVKISAPILLSLNKPLINILDQVSEMHGKDSHKRMCNRISELMEKHLESAVGSLVDEAEAFLTLKEFPKYILYDLLRNFNVTEEPFFRSMIRSSALVGLHRLVDKMQIKIPASQGRMMFGVVDETGLLQYGQVFIQYTANAALKYPSQHADKIVHTGPVMITKNPSVVSGDVRMFEAVDLPCLYDLVDVVVFPQSGPRPHPDEMAGSDLDGDEYSIFWDPQLFLDRNEPAFDFSATSKNEAPGSEAEVKENLTELMIQFFTKYVKQDAIGTIANAHLANSDLYGINSEHCYNIALKHNQAVDFAKSGKIPEPLRNKWEGGLPPEKVERFPNFMTKLSQSSYKSNRLLGALFQRCMEVREIIRVEEISSADEKVKVDPSVLMLGDAVFQGLAHTAYDEYRTLIESICESYGIVNEGQLFSGRFTALKKRISDKDDDNMSLFNTQHMIEEQVATIYSKFRSKFFDGFGGIEKCTELDERKYNGIRETFRRTCVFPSDLMRKKASAYYRIAYENGKYLSFAWLVADILSFNRQKYLLEPGNFKLSLCPLTDYLSDHINNVCNSSLYNDEFSKFCNSLQKSYAAKKSSKDATFYVSKMCHHFKGLDKLLFICRKWVERHGIGYNQEDKSEIKYAIKPKIMDAIVVMFGMGELKREAGGWLTVPNFDNDDDSSIPIIDLEEQLGGIGKRFWSFIRFLMTRNFGYSEKISLEPVTKRFVESSQCLALFFAAESTFYPIAVNRRFDCLPGAAEDQKVVQKITEGLTFTVDVPKDVQHTDYKHLFESLALKCGCKYFALRKKPVRINAKTFRVTLKPVGSFMAVRKFRSLLDVSPCMDEQDLEVRSDMIAKEIYQRIVFYNKEDRSIDDVFEP